MKKENQYRPPREGDIAVRIKSNPNGKKGQMKLFYNGYSDDGRFPYSQCQSLLKGCWRYATPKEIKAFEKGIEYIQDIPEEPELMYNVF